MAKSLQISSGPITVINQTLRGGKSAAGASGVAPAETEAGLIWKFIFHPTAGSSLTVTSNAFEGLFGGAAVSGTAGKYRWQNGFVPLARSATMPWSPLPGTRNPPLAVAAATLSSGPGTAASTGTDIVDIVAAASGRQWSRLCVGHGLLYPWGWRQASKTKPPPAM